MVFKELALDIWRHYQSWKTVWLTLAPQPKVKSVVGFLLQKAESTLIPPSHLRETYFKPETPYINTMPANGKDSIVTAIYFVN